MKCSPLEFKVSYKFQIVLFLLLFILHKPAMALSEAYHDRLHGGILIIGEFVKPSLINPILTHGTISAVLKEIIFDGLVRINEQMESEPHLALSWNSHENGLVWIFYLRKNVHFHDGIELTAEDVKFTFDKINDPSIDSPYISIFKNIRTVIIKDRYIVEINLNNPLPSLPFYLKDIGILPKHLLEGKDIIRNEFNYRPIGTGPFKLQHWSRDEITLKANKNYFRGQAYLEWVKVKFFNKQSIVWAELMKGNVDCVFLTSSKNYDIIEKISDFNVYSFLNPYYYIFAFNENNKYFNQSKVRQALNYSIDKKKIVAKVLRGKGRVSCGTIYPQSLVYNKAIEPYPYDQKMALKLLENAGWKDTNANHILDKDGREFEFVLLIIKGDDVAGTCALLIQQQLLDIGIRMKVKALPFSILYEQFLSTRKFDASILSIVSDNPERNYMWWHSSQIDHGFNVFSYRNKKVDDLLNKGRTILDRKEREEIYHQFQREIYEDPPGIFLFWRDYLIGIHKRFKGVKLSPAGILNNINEWYVPEPEQKYR